MKKEATESSQPERLVRVNGEDIWRQGLSDEQRKLLRRLAARPDSEIDFSDIPEISEERLKHFRPIKRAVNLRIDADVLAWFKRERGYQTRINALLREEMVRGIKSQAK